MKSLIRAAIIKVFLYAFGPEKGRSGIRLMSLSDGSFILCLADENGSSLASIKMVGGHLELESHLDIKLSVRGSILSEVSGSHWECVSGVKAVSAKVLSHQDGELNQQVRDIHGLDLVLRRRAHLMICNAQQLQENMECEQCGVNHSHAPSLPVK